MLRHRAACLPQKNREKEKRRGIGSGVKGCIQKIIIGQADAKGGGISVLGDMGLVGDSWGYDEQGTAFAVIGAVFRFVEVFSLPAVPELGIVLVLGSWPVSGGVFQLGNLDRGRNAHKGTE